jgi:predicted HicB family RNase H-like nuclease
MAKRKPPKGPKEESLRIRISTVEKQALNDAAARDGLSLSAWLRRVTLQAAGYLPRSRT